MDMFFSRRRWMQSLGASFLVVFAAGCATGAGGISGATLPGAGTDKAALLERSQAYWDAVQRNDRVKAWSYEAVSKDPAWTLEGYLKRGGIVYNKVEVRAVKSADGDKAVVDVWMSYSVPLLRLKGQEAVLQDEWRLIDGAWHHVLKRSVMFQDS